MSGASGSAAGRPGIAPSTGSRSSKKGSAAWIACRPAALHIRERGDADARERAVERASSGRVLLVPDRQATVLGDQAPLEGEVQRAPSPPRAVRTASSSRVAGQVRAAMLPGVRGIALSPCVHGDPLPRRRTTVTGSQSLLVTARARVLIDCGMFQGSPNESIRNRIPFDYAPAELDAVLLTHAHLDHCGLLPVLVREGYAGPIHTTAGTVELATVVLLDSGHLHEEFAKRDARWEKRHPDKVAADDRKQADAYEAAVELAADGEDGVIGGPAEPGEHVATTVEPVRSPEAPSSWPRDPEAELRAQPAVLDIHLDAPLYTVKDAERVVPQFAPVDYGVEIEVAPGVHATFLDAGHILGSAIIRLRVTGRRGRRRTDHRVLRRPRPARDAHPARPDGRDRRRLRPRGVHVRRARARTRSRGDPGPGRDDPDGRGDAEIPLAVVDHAIDLRTGEIDADRVIATARGFRQPLRAVRGVDRLRYAEPDP